jgi:hypothetical protein
LTASPSQPSILYVPSFHPESREERRVSMFRRLVPILVSVVCLVLPAAAQNTKSLLLRKPFQIIGQQAVVPNCPGSGEELKPPATITANHAEGMHVRAVPSGGASVLVAGTGDARALMKVISRTAAVSAAVRGRRA